MQDPDSPQDPESLQDPRSRRGPESPQGRQGSASKATAAGALPEEEPPRAPELLAVATLASPVGELRIAATQIGVVKVSFPGGPRSDFNAWLASQVPRAKRVARLPLLDEACGELRAYFEGRLHAFSTSLDLRGSAFQRATWCEVAAIPYGEVRTYGELAGALGRPGAARAVGAASGANPVPLFVPCHRVVAAHGRLGGFGGGLAAKRTLLALERRTAPALTLA